MYEVNGGLLIDICGDVVYWAFRTSSFIQGAHETNNQSPVSDGLHNRQNALLPCGLVTLVKDLRCLRSTLHFGLSNRTVTSSQRNHGPWWTTDEMETENGKTAVWWILQTVFISLPRSVSSLTMIPMPHDLYSDLWDIYIYTILFSISTSVYCLTAVLPLLDLLSKFKSGRAYVKHSRHFRDHFIRSDCPHPYTKNFVSSYPVPARRKQCFRGYKQPLSIHNIKARSCS